MVSMGYRKPPLNFIVPLAALPPFSSPKLQKAPYQVMSP